jgi:hypothetical protein
LTEPATVQIGLHLPKDFILASTLLSFLGRDSRAPGAENDRSEKSEDREEGRPVENSRR